MASPVLGIDLGTTNSAMAVVNDYGRPEILTNREGSRITPSVVMFDGDEPVVGEIAKQSTLERPLDTVQFVKRQMGERSWSYRSESGRSYSAEEVSAFILRRLKDDAEDTLGKPVERAVISVPAYFDDASRTATMDAAKIAGLEVLRIINEPTAAAVSYGVDANTSETILVYDLGGGTFDVTVMQVGGGELRAIATGGDRQLGGYDWDNALMTWLDERFQAAGGPSLLDDPRSEQLLRDSAVRAKHTLSNRDETNVFLRAHGFSEKVSLSRDQFDDITSDLLNRTARFIDVTLDDAGLAWPSISKVLLVGGSTRMRQVVELVAAISGKRPSLEVNPDEVVALGAAVQGAVSNGATTQSSVPILTASGRQVPALRVQDVTAHSIGVVTINDFYQEVNSVILPRNSQIPGEGSGVFATMDDYQNVWQCQVTEGEDEDLNYVRIVGTGEIGLPGRYPAGAPVGIRLGYDTNGVVHVFLHDLVSGLQIGELHIQRTANLDMDAVSSSRERLDRTGVS